MKNMRELKGERHLYNGLNRSSDISCLKFCIKYGQGVVNWWRIKFYKGGYYDKRIN